MEEHSEVHVGQIIRNFDAHSIKKAAKKENTMISFIIKAIARKQDLTVAISKLKREIQYFLDRKTELEAESKVKEDFLREKDEKLKELKNENEKLKSLLKQSQHKSLNNLFICNSNNDSLEFRTPEKRCDNKRNYEIASTKILQDFDKKDYEVVSTFSNIVASPKDQVLIGNLVESSTFENPLAKVAMLKSNVLRRSSRKKRNSFSLPSIVYNLRRNRN